MSGNKGKKMERCFLEVMRFQDKILEFKRLDGEQLHEACLRFKTLLGKCPTHELLDTVILKSFYQSLSLVSRIIANQITLGNLIQNFYKIIPKMLDSLTDLKQETKMRDFYLVILLTQLDELTAKIVDLEVQCYVLPSNERKLITRMRGKSKKC